MRSHHPIASQDRIILPGTALKPTVPQPGLVPFVISFNIHGFEYSAGLINPIGFLLTLRRASLMRLMMEEKMGVDALVPPSVPKAPWLYTAMLSPFAATSGYLLLVSIHAHDKKSRNSLTPYRYDYTDLHSCRSFRSRCSMGKEDCVSRRILLQPLSDNQAGGRCC